MTKLINKFGKLIFASFVVMAIGVVTFLLVIPLYGFFRIDTDVLGILIIEAGIVMFIVGIIRRIKMRRVWMVLLSILAFVLSLPVLFLIVGVIYYLIAGKPMT